MPTLPPTCAKSETNFLLASLKRPLPLFFRRRPCPAHDASPTRESMPNGGCWLKWVHTRMAFHCSDPFFRRRDMELRRFGFRLSERGHWSRFGIVSGGDFLFRLNPARSPPQLFHFEFHWSDEHTSLPAQPPVTGGRVFFLSAAKQLRTLLFTNHPPTFQPANNPYL